jgi:hypothetical protein
MKIKCEICSRKAKKRFSTEGVNRCGRHSARNIMFGVDFNESLHQLNKLSIRTK